jgi:hypothetical protein
MSNAPRDDNRVTTLIGVSENDLTTPTTIAVDPITHELLTQSSGSVISDTKFNTNHIDDYTTTNVTYICQETADGIWRIKKIDSTGSFPVFTWASVTNNPTVTSYTAAYTARVTLQYGLYNLAF